MISDQYVWFFWSVLFLFPWLILYVMYPRWRKVMLRSSLLTAPFGLTEPLFVPEYWNPPSLFNLAQTTGFDLESLIFCFGIGGVGVVLYNAVTNSNLKDVCPSTHSQSRHRFHRLVLFSPFLLFIALSFFPWNAIYPGIIAMIGGSIATMICRPDLTKKSWIGGTIFLIYYFIFLIALECSAPGYIERVWNHDVLTGLNLFGFPIEEFLFALGFGMYWSSVYEHLSWKRLVANQGNENEN